MERKLESIDLDIWRSTSGKGISATVKGLFGTFLPVIHLILGIQIAGPEIDRLIDAVVVLISAIYAFWGYARSKRALGAEIRRLGNMA